MGRPQIPGYTIPGPSTLIRGSTTSRTGQIRTDSPGRARSMSAWRIRWSFLMASRSSSRLTSRTPSLHWVLGPKTMSSTGNVPISRRMDYLPGRLHFPRVKKSGANHRSLKGFQCRSHDLKTIGVIFLRPQLRVAAYVLDSSAPDNPVGSGVHGQGVNSRDHSHGNADPLNLFADRCTATIAGPSSGHQYRTVYTRFSKLAGNLPSQTLGLSYWGTYSRQGENSGKHPANYTLSLKLSHLAQGQDVVGIFAGNLVVISTVISLPIIGCQHGQAFNGVGKISISIPRGLPVRVAFG